MKKTYLYFFLFYDFAFYSLIYNNFKIPFLCLFNNLS